MRTSPFLVWFADIPLDIVSHISKEGKKLGSLTQAGFPVPPGFIVSKSAYYHFLKENKLEHKIKALLSTVNFEQPETLPQVSQHLKRLITTSPLPHELETEIQIFYHKLGGIPVTLHAFSTTKDTPKYVKYYAKDLKAVTKKIKGAWAAHFEAGLLAHRNERDVNHLETGTEIVIQTVIHPEKTGKLLTIDPTSHTKDRLFISTSTPHAKDIFELSKKTLMILERKLAPHTKVKKLTHDELLTIAKLGKAVEQHLYFPQEIEWAIAKDKLYILSARPITSLSETKQEAKRKLPISRGTSITANIGSGIVKIIRNDHEIKRVKKGDIAVLPEIQLQYLPHLKKTHGVINETGHRHSELATKLRQLGIPSIFGVKNATKLFHDGNVITVHGGKGEIYKGGFN